MHFAHLRPEYAQAGLRAGRESAETEALTSLQIGQDECEVLHGNSVLRPVNRPTDRSVNQSLKVKRLECALPYLILIMNDYHLSMS